MAILAIQETASAFWYGGTLRVTPSPIPIELPQTRARLVAKKQASANVCSGFIGMATPRTLGVATDHMNTSV
eukprot:scaffold122844_cov42-Phaeocystis_antarctica.AAC.2